MLEDEPDEVCGGLVELFSFGGAGSELRAEFADVDRLADVIELRRLVLEAGEKARIAGQIRRLVALQQLDGLPLRDDGQTRKLACIDRVATRVAASARAADGR